MNKRMYRILGRCLVVLPFAGLFAVLGVEDPKAFFLLLGGAIAIVGSITSGVYFMQKGSDF